MEVKKHYGIKEYKGLTQGERVNITILELLPFLQKSGGEASRRDFEAFVAKGHTPIPPDWPQTYFRGKNGPYLKWFFDFNFARKQLEISELLTFDKHGMHLTEGGMEADSTAPDFLGEVNARADRYYEEKKEGTVAEAQAELEVKTGVRADELVDAWRSDIRDILREMDPYDFEIFSRRLLKRMGVAIDRTLGQSKSGDGGLDGFGYITSDDFRTARVAIQSKRYLTGRVTAPLVQQFKGAIMSNNAEYGVFITTSTFTEGAREEAVKGGGNPVTLIDMEGILDLIEKYEMGLKPVHTYVVDKEYFNF